MSEAFFMAQVAFSFLPQRSGVLFLLDPKYKVDLFFQESNKKMAMSSSCPSKLDDEMLLWLFEI